ncbi:hypothetical protein [Plantactinospora soyae]|uniref:Uncharacterized protein n=1 Tax=Plantactinospora soyae TaxID=1544732 RepID=A0A927M1H1_9ACTN|nr:hypothetical protein [Plantactinospora soyae]MBE1484991.1 hypothetical protein [Plantactinospora soyae]
MTHRSPFDVVFLSYDEPLADALYARLSDTFGRVKRLHGVHGMRRAYQLTAEMVDSEFLFIADADFEIAADFNPEEVCALDEEVAMRVWRTVNAVNGLVYGHGGLKLCRRQALRDLRDDVVDVLAGLPGRIEFTPTVAGRTRFNQSAFHAWRAGFRECAMLARGCEYGTTSADALARLDTWTSTGAGPYAADAIAGARAGTAFATDTPPDDSPWQNLNDPAWLAQRYAASR